MGLAFGDALHLRRVQGIDLVRVLGALRQQARDAGPGGRKRRLQGRIPSDLAADVSLEPAQPGSHLAHVALGLSVGAGVNEAAHLTLGAGGQAQKGLAQPDPMPPAFDPDDERGIEYYTAWLIGEAAKA